MQSPDALVAAFREAGLKVTPQRQLLFRLLDDNVQHPTADALHAEATAQMPGISLRTVYTTLTDLAEMGEIHALTLGSGAMRFDPNTSEHHHLVCEGCGHVADVYVDGVDDLAVDDFDGFDARSTSIVFRGRCSACRR